MKKLIFYILFVNISLALSQDELIKPNNLMLLTIENGISDCPYPVYLDTTGIGKYLLEDPTAIKDSRYYENRLYSRGIFEFSNTNFKKKYNLLNNKKSSNNLYDIESINNEYNDLKEKLTYLSESFGSYKLVKVDESPNSNLIFIFDELVNVQEIEFEFKKLHQDFNFEFKCYPKFLLHIPNERTFIPGVWPREVLSGDYSSTEYWYSNNYHRRGWNWHHYSLKTPLAWELTLSSQNIVIGAEDVFDCDAPVTNTNLIDLTIHNNSGGNNGNWTQHLDTDVTDGHYGKNTPAITTNVSSGSHGLVVLSYAISYSNNDNLLSTPNSPAGGLVGTAPKSRGIAINYMNGWYGSVGCTNFVNLSNVEDLDNDLTSNGYIN